MGVMTKIKSWQCRFVVGKNSSQQVHKSTTTDRGNKEQSLAHSYLDKVQHVYVQVVIGSRNAEKEKGEQMYRGKKIVSRQLTICSLGYWRSRTSPVLVHDGTFSLCDTLKKTAEYKCHITAIHQTTNSNTTALTQNASQTFSTEHSCDLYLTYTCKKKLQKRSRRLFVSYSFFCKTRIRLSHYICNYKTIDS